MKVTQINVQRGPPAGSGKHLIQVSLVFDLYDINGRRIISTAIWGEESDTLEKEIIDWAKKHVPDVDVGFYYQ